MSDQPALPDLASQLRRLLEAVKGAACAIEGRWGWFAAPMLLLTWVRSRRERREAAMAMAAVQGMLQALLGVVEDFRAGRLAQCVPEAEEAEDGVDGAVAYPPPRPSPARAGEGANCTGGAVAYPSSRCAGPSSVRFAAQPLKGRGIVGGTINDDDARVGVNGTDVAVAPPSRQPRGSSPRAGLPIKGEGEDALARLTRRRVDLATQWIPLRAGMTGTFVLFAWARPPPQGRLQKPGGGRGDSCAHYVAITQRKLT